MEIGINSTSKILSESLPIPNIDIGRYVENKRNNKKKFNTSIYEYSYILILIQKLYQGLFDYYNALYN